MVIGDAEHAQEKIVEATEWTEEDQAFAHCRIVCDGKNAGKRERGTCGHQLQHQYPVSASARVHYSHSDCYWSGTERASDSLAPPRMR